MCKFMAFVQSNCKLAGRIGLCNLHVYTACVTPLLQNVLLITERSHYIVIYAEFVFKHVCNCLNLISEYSF